MIKYKCSVCGKIEFYEYPIYHTKGKVPICIHGEFISFMVQS